MKLPLNVTAILVSACLTIGCTELVQQSPTARRRPVKLNMKQGLTMNQVVSVYALTEAPTERCRNLSIEFSRGLRAFEAWALQMFDSSSKLQSGILAGNLVEYGAFQQCLAIYKDTPGGAIRGKQCAIKVIPDIKLLKNILEFRNISSKRFEKVYTFVKNAALLWSVCVPDACGPPDLVPHFERLIYTLTEGLSVNVSASEDDCYTIFSDLTPFTAIELATIGLLGAVVALVAMCTVIELYSAAGRAGKFVNVFSAYTNTKQIFARSKAGKSSDLDCVHGIRFLSTCYVVIGHRYLMLMFFPVVNSLQIMNWVLFYRSTAITGGTLCVDTFFMISGMLVAVGYFQEAERRGGVNWPLFYLYRYMRITPPLAIVVLIHAQLAHRLGSGPLWNDMLAIVQTPCREYWWATLLHVQNYVHPFPLCMTQAWYLTCDMQYYFLSPIILVPLSKFGNYGLINFGIIYTLSVAVSFYLAWINKYSGGVPVTNQLFSTEYFQYHYIVPHTRAATYIIGLGLGYAIHRNRAAARPKLPRPLVVAAWLLTASVMLACLVGCHPFHLEHHDYNRLESSIYLSFSRSAWTCGLVWIVWACTRGYGGPINWVLSSHLFRVLGRISYSIYLLHMLMQYLTSGAAKNPGYFSDFSALYAAFSDLFLMVIIGFAFTVCFESPLVKILSVMLKTGITQGIKVDPGESK